MLQKAIKYVDYNNNEKTDTFYFHMSKAELIKRDLVTEGGFQNHIKRIIESKDRQLVMDTFEDIILSSYGVLSIDGQHFDKSPELAARFKNSEPYSELFIELLTNEEAAIEFMNGIVPKDVAQQANLTSESISDKIATL